MTDHQTQENIPQEKPFWQSKTMWFNAVSLIIVVATVLADPAIYGPEVTKWAVPMITLGNAVLRLITNQPVALKPAKVVARPEAGVEESGKDTG